MADPHIMADFDRLPDAGFAETLVDLRAHEILVRAVGHLVLADAAGWMVQRVDPHIRSDSAELADCRVNHFRVALDIGIIAKGGIPELHAFLQFGEAPERGVAERCRPMHAGGAVARGGR